MGTYRIATLPGDGIGKEVVPQAVRVVDAAGAKYGFGVRWQVQDWGCEQFVATGRMMPEDALETLARSDAIFLGAVGDPRVADHESLWGMLIPIRRAFRQYANLRPLRLFEGVSTPLADRAPGSIDFCIVRENNEGEYSEMGGRIYRGTEQEMAVQESVFTRQGVDRILRYAFEVAQTRRKKVTSATKSNGIIHTMPFWDERFAAISAEYPDVETDQFHIDILSAHLVQHPDWFDVIVASNLFGDILSDLGAAVAGGMGLAPAGNINPECEYPSMFEPVHGSAPDIAGKGIANPVAQIWTAAMMLEHLGETKAAAAIEAAIARVLAEGRVRTADLGGTATTAEMGDAIVAAM